MATRPRIIVVDRPGDAADLARELPGRDAVHVPDLVAALQAVQDRTVEGVYFDTHDPALRSRADRRRVREYFRDNLMNLLEPDGRFWGLFTPWHPDDLNAHLKINPAYSHFRRAVGDDLQPVWPEKWPSEHLAERRAEIGSLSFARAYRLTCIPGGADPDRLGALLDPRSSSPLRGEGWGEGRLRAGDPVGGPGGVVQE